MLHKSPVVLEGEWSCYGGGQFKGGKMVILQRCSVVAREWSCYGGSQFNGGRIVMLQRWTV